MNAGTKYGCYGDILREMRVFDFCSGPKSVLRDEIEFGYRCQTLAKTGLILAVTLELTPSHKQKIAENVKHILEERASKQPLDYPSCGSTFRNPTGLSAGRLIEQAGLKGLRVGDAEISRNTPISS